MGTEVLLGRLLVVSKYMNVDIRILLSDKQTTLPTSLFYDDSTKGKTDRSDLAKNLDSVCVGLIDLPRDESYKYD